MQPQVVDASDVVITPTILTNDPEEFTKAITLYPTFAKRIQIDVSDGTFVATSTIPVSAIAALPQGVQIDLHMMVARPSEYIPHILRLKPSLCIFHAEAAEDLLPVFAQLKQAGIRTGVAILQKTYPGLVEQYIKAADYTLVFAGALGRNGGKIDLLQVEKVKIVRRINPNAEIGWDGGIGKDNVRTLAHSNINVLNVGSYILKAEDPKAAYEELCTEAVQRGVAI